MKYHLFIDESGDPSLSSVNADFPVFTLMGCLFEDLEYQKMCGEISRFKKELLGTEDAVLHSRDIRKCEGVFQKLFNLDVKKEFYERLNSIITKGEFVIICVVINKRDFISKYGKLGDDPYELSLSFLLERAVMETDKGTQDTLEIMLESRGTKEDKILQKISLTK